MAVDDKGADTGAARTLALTRARCRQGHRDDPGYGARQGRGRAQPTRAALPTKARTRALMPRLARPPRRRRQGLRQALGRYSDRSRIRQGASCAANQTVIRRVQEGAAGRRDAEELATWRKENGLPDKAEGYVEKLELPKGLVLGEADKPIVAEFAAAALAGNVDPKQFNGMVGKYYEILDKQRAAQEDADAAFKTESEEALRTEWQGADFRRNLTAVNNLISTWPGDLATNVLAARGPDGRKLGDSPAR
jgi:hypothetical protein